MPKILPALFLFALSCSATPRGEEPRLISTDVVVKPTAEPVLMDSLQVFGRVVFRALHLDAVGAEVRITCKEGCVLTVLFRDSETKAQGRDYHDRVRSKWTLDLTGEVDTWANQIATSTFTNIALEEPKDVGGIMGMLVGSDDTPRIMVRDKEFSGEWARKCDWNRSIMNRGTQRLRYVRRTHFTAGEVRVSALRDNTFGQSENQG